MFAIKKKIARPTLFHITHPKAGSQWIHKLLIKCFSKKNILLPLNDNEQFLNHSILPTKIYPTLYITQEQFNSVKLPNKWIRFVVIRDLRDTLISLYFSLKISHPIISVTMEQERQKLFAINNLENELIYLLNHIRGSAIIQQSWLNANEQLLYYEDLIENDVEILTPILENLLIPKKKIHKSILATRFEKLTKGRKRGQEDIRSHDRKGTPGDWQYYFSAKVKDSFKEHYGSLLIKTGYENNNNW